MLEGSALHFSSGEDEGEEEVLQLKQLQELSKNFNLFFFNDKSSVVLILSNYDIYRQVSELSSLWPSQTKLILVCLE